MGDLPLAKKDCDDFRDYLLEEYGVKNENIKYLYNTSFDEAYSTLYMKNDFNWLKAKIKDTTKKYLIFYCFAGHGV